MVKTEHSKKTEKTLLRIVLLALFSAMAFVLYLFELPVFPAQPHLKLDFSDIPALIGSVIFGPVFGVLVELIKNVIELVVKGFGSQMGFGNIMNFVVGCAFVVPFSIVFRHITSRNKNKKALAAVLAGIVSVVSILLFGAVGNYLIAPLFFKLFLGIELSKAALWSAVGWATALNAVKGAMLWAAALPLVAVIKERLGKELKKAQQ
ncbi:MAG: ECF transporter S component [Clostridiales bacterium]|nr:ECF transporter S component [Clostridiales bacterium]